MTEGEKGFEGIVKRNGRVVAFEPQKIANAIAKAFKAQGIEDRKTPVALAQRVVAVARARLGKVTPTVEQIQDMVEEVLIEAGYAQVAKAYILYRQKRSDIRAAKGYLGVVDDLKLGVNALEVLQKRYLKKDEAGRVTESPGEMFARVSTAVAEAESRWGGDVALCRQNFYRAMTSLQFLPNSPTLMNAGLPLGQLSACFVIPVEDSLTAIFEALKQMAIIHQSGGGTGFSFSRLRPRNDAVRSTGGVASGPVSFMGIFDAATEVIKQGGRRRGANMGVLRYDHPDILEFVSSKEVPGRLENFNISVALDGEFMDRVRQGKTVDLVNPRNGQVTGTLGASDLLQLMATSAWRGGDPGVLFLDRINQAHPLPGDIEATNPCGEQPLLPYESCVLGSINLSLMVEEGEVDWGQLGEMVDLGVRFLDDVIEVNRFPLPQIKEATLASRKIGLGVMGFAEMLISLGISYGSPEALKIAEQVMKFITSRAREASTNLGRERGSFPLFEMSSLRGYEAMRNATLTTIAPTGTISIIAGTSSGIEPLFAVSFVHRVLEGSRLIETSPLFERMARERDIWTPGLQGKIARKGSLAEVEEVPQELKDLFKTALEVTPEEHVRMQAAFQRHTDNAVSKTVNLAQTASVGDVLKIYRLAYDLGCKGVTVYRYGSRSQVLYLGSAEKAVEEECRYCG